MKALFLMTETADCENHMRAWESVYGPAADMRFLHSGRNVVRNDWQLIEAAELESPDIMFYIGAVNAPGTPTVDTLRQLGTMVPMIHLVCDATDKPWHALLRDYNALGCFAAQVSIDGGGPSELELITLTPVDDRAFDQHVPDRDILCGFSGSVGSPSPRSEIVRALEWFGGLTIAPRDPARSYADHAAFMLRCEMLLNVSRTGSGHRHHIKGRVLEAGFAECCLLEPEHSPIGGWFPDDCYITYRDPPHAAELIKTTRLADARWFARRLSEEVRHRYTARQIYSSILDAAHVDHPEPVART